MKNISEEEKSAKHSNRGIEGTQWLGVGIMFIIGLFVLHIMGLNAIASFLVLAAVGGLYAFAQK